MCANKMLVMTLDAELPHSPGEKREGADSPVHWLFKGLSRGTAGFPQEKTDQSEEVV